MASTGKSTFYQNLMYWWKNSKEAKSFIVYLAFTVVFSIVAFDSRPGKIQFYVNSYVKETFATEAFGNVATYDDFVGYMKGDFTSALFREVGYDGKILDRVQRKHVMGDGRIMGAIRMRQIRGTSKECPTPKKLTQVEIDTNGVPILDPICNKSVNRMKQSKLSYGNTTIMHDFALPFKYQTRQQLDSLSFPEEGTYGIYGQDGFNLDILPVMAAQRLAQEVRNCYSLMEQSTLACMAAQSMVYDPPPVAPPPPYPPPPPPLTSADSDTVSGLSMAIKAPAIGEDAYRVDIHHTFNLSPTNTTASLAFEIFNLGSVQLNWQLRALGVNETRPDWFVSAAPLSSSVPAMAGNAAYKSTVTVNVARPADYNTTERALLSVDGVPPSSSVQYLTNSTVLTFESVEDPLTHVRLHLNVLYTYVPDSGSSRRRQLASLTPADSFIEEAQRRGLTSSSLNIYPVFLGQSICTIPTLHKPVALNTNACRVIGFDNLYNLKCRASAASLVAQAINAQTSGDAGGCCRLKYLSYQQLADLMTTAKCGDCLCAADSDAQCSAKCSTRAIFHNQLDRLTQINWFDDKTRAIVVDFTILYASRNLFTSVRLLFETPDFGGRNGAIFAKVKTRTYRLYRYETSADKLVMIFEIILMCFVVYYTLHELYEIYREGWAYFGVWWNYIDWANLIILYVVFGIRLTMLKRVSDNDDYAATSIEYIDFAPLGYYSNQELNVSSINFFLIYFKIFKYLRHLPRMDAIFTTISAASFDLFLFTIMAVIIFFGFASAFYVCFGMELEAWKTIGDSLGSLMRILLGDFDYPELQEVNKIMAPLLFYLFIFVSFFVLLNMFIAIICDSYADVKAAQDDEDLRFYENLFRTIQSTISNFLRRKAVIHEITKEMKEADKDNDNRIDEDELREALKDNPEALQLLDSTTISELLQKYDIDEDGVLDKDEMVKILEDLAKKEQDIQKEISRVKSGASDRDAPHSRDGDYERSRIRAIKHGQLSGARDGMFADSGEMSIRLDRVESQVKDMSRNMAKKLSLMIDLIMSVSDQLTNSNAARQVNQPGQPTRAQVMPLN